MTHKPSIHKGQLLRHWRVWLALINLLLAVANLSTGHYWIAANCTLLTLVLADSVRRSQRRPVRRSTRGGGRR
jgi:hypothetical protein